MPKRIFFSAVAILQMVLMACPVSYAADKPTKWFIGGSVIQGKFVPMADLACTAAPRWNATPKQLSKQTCAGWNK